MVCEIPKEIIMRDDFLKKLHEKHPFRAGVTLMRAGTMYNWHRDSKRMCGVNMMIWHSGSNCLFADTAPIEGGTFRVYELKYDEGYYYAFNTQVDHCVINLHGDRYMFTLEFDEEIGYERLVSSH